MALPLIQQDDEAIGFCWSDPDGTRLTLLEVIRRPGAEPDRWLPTHLEALDDVLIDLAARFGEVLGGGRLPEPGELGDLDAAHRVVDRICHEYGEAHAATGLPDDLRAGQIIGTATIMTIHARHVLGLTGPPPFDGLLDEPPVGVVGGRAGLHHVDEHERWRGARWLVVTEDGLRLPATLSMLLNDSSGVDSQAALREHREALVALIEEVRRAPDAEVLTATGAIDWLLYDWVMAHRDGPDSGAVEIPPGQVVDAAMIVAAVTASVALRARTDPALLRVR